MYRLQAILITSVLFLIFSGSNKIAGQKKKNLGFETGNFTGWKGTAWIYRPGGGNQSKITSPVTAIDIERHFIISDQNGYDPITGNRLKLIPSGYRYSAKLGTSTIPTGERVVGGQHQTLSYTMKIDSSNAFLLWKFAVVLQDPASNHAYDEEPRFKISLLNEKGDTIPDCTYYDVYAGDANIKGFQTYIPPGNNPTAIVWRDWVTVGANLLPYIGRTITIEFLSAGCTKAGHYGYGYFVLDCLPLYITVDYCRNAKTASLIGPEGFEKYEWFDNKGIPAGTGQTLTLNEPEEGVKYSCNLTSATGCKVTLNTTVKRYWPDANFSNSLINCNDTQNLLRFSITNKTPNGSLDYNWKFPDNDSTDVQNPVHSFKTISGLNPVTLIVYNPPSACSDTVTKIVESFYPPSVKPSGYFTYCPGEKTVIKGTGAFKYKWFNGSTKDSIEIDKDTKGWMIGYSSNDCYSDTIWFEVKQEPDWPFNPVYNPILCKGDTVSVGTSGNAVKYLWNTSETTSSIQISREGTYSVTGTNVRGCKKRLSVDITEDELPKALFELDKHVVDKRHNTISGKIKQEDLINYNWDFGDGENATGNSVLYAYNVKPEDLVYNVKVTATNENGCNDNSVQQVVADVFIPNVFTPNGDGTNDIFMPGYPLKVFDRNGKTLYSGNEGWNGLFNGRPMSPDTYFFTLEYINYQNETHKKQGYITLVR